MKDERSGKHQFRTALVFVILCAWGTSSVYAQNDALRVYAARRGFFIGAAVDMAPFGSEFQYQDTLRREFNVIVAENAFKFDATHPVQNTYNFTSTDALVTFAETNGMKIRGHTLIWHNQLPSWLVNGNFSRDQTIAIMRDHIRTLVTRYRGRVWAWDVVNEAIADGSSSLRTNSFWHQKIGPDYIKLAFQYAHEADPDAILYINDYSIEGLGAKSDGLYNLVRDLIQEGIPVHGVGWQAHFTHGFRINADHHANAQRLTALGVEISITEMDVRMPLPTSPEKLQTQATSYREVAEFCLAQPNCVALMTWGFTDKYSWIEGFFPGQGAALPFDATYVPKPAYQALSEVFSNAASSPIFIQFDAASYNAAETDGTKEIVVTRTGNMAAVAVDYTFTNGTASNRSDFTFAQGTLRFAAGETSRTLTVFITDDALVEPEETVRLTLSHPQGTNLGSPSSATLSITSNDVAGAPNPVDSAQFFVRQHYRDFLNRDPDQPGLDYWTNVITSCGADAQCTEVNRINVSAAFFLSIEFQETGYLVYRLHTAAYGTGPRLGHPVFLRDTQEIGRGIVVGQGNWEAELEENKREFINAFSTSPQFAARYPQTLPAAQFVDALNQNAANALSQTERDTLIAELAAGTKTRADVLRAIAENAVFRQANFNRAFVFMQYVGYLRRSPNAPPDSNLDGFNFWLNKLNQFGGNFVQAEMVKAFIQSIEYKERFGV